MPIIQVNMFEGRTPEMKEELIHRVTETVVDVLHVQPSAVRIIIHDMAPQDFGVGGQSKAKTDREKG